jgi:hypothetical protein
MFSISTAARRIGVALTLASALLGVTASVAVVDAGTSVSVSVSCNTNPERTTVKNRGTTTFTVTKVGSTYLPRSNEPFRVSKTLQPGQSITFQTGYDATRNILTRQYIYNNDTRDGAKVVTSAGIFKRYC